jgi:hypothetical protein
MRQLKSSQRHYLDAGRAGHHRRGKYKGNLLQSGLSGAARPGPAVSTGTTPRATAGAADFYEDGCMRDDDGGRNPPSPWTRR